MTFGTRKFTGFLGAATVVIIAEYILVLSDSIISGRVLGETALGAMNLLMPVFSSISFFTMLLAVGTSIVYSDAMSRMEVDRATKVAGQGFVAAVVLGLTLVAVTKCLEGPYLAFMAPDDATTEFSGQYWDWYPLVVLLESVDLLLLYLVYTDGGEVACTLSYLGQVIVNVGASYWLCNRMGMAGISLGTVIAYATGILFLLPRIYRPAVGGLRFRFAFLPAELKRSLTASFGDASAGLFHAALFFVITKYVLANWGGEALPVTAVVFCIVRLTVFFNGVGIALQPLETVYHGEGNVMGVDRLVRFAAGIAFAEGVFLSAVVFIAPELVVSLVGIDDPDLVVSAKRAARLSVTGLSGYAIVYLLNSHYQYVGRPDRSVKITALAFFVVPVVLLFAFGAVWGMDGVWVAVATGPACALMTFLPFLKRRTKRGPDPMMWTVNLARPGKELRVTRRVGDAVARIAGAAMSVRVTDVLLIAFKRIIEHNAKGTALPRVRVEVTVKHGEHGEVTLILRDDGAIFPIDDAGVPVTHVPVTGFNRNVFEFDKRISAPERLVAAGRDGIARDEPPPRADVTQKE